MYMLMAHTNILIKEMRFGRVNMNNVHMCLSIITVLMLKICGDDLLHDISVDLSRVNCYSRNAITWHILHTCITVTCCVQVISTMQTSVIAVYIC